MILKVGYKRCIKVGNKYKFEKYKTNEKVRCGKIIVKKKNCLFICVELKGKKI